MKRKKHGLLTLSWILCVLVLSYTFLPHSFFANSSDPSLETSTAKIAAKLNEQFNKNENVTFLIKLKDQVDSLKITAETADKAKDQNLTTESTKLMKRTDLVSSLRTKANETQSSIKDYLNQEQKKGTVKHFQSFYIVNALAVTGTKEVMNKLATFPEVEKILPNETIQLVSPTTKNPNKSAQSQVEPLAGTNSIEWNINQIKAPQVWNMGINGTGTVVATIDTGVQWNHPALKEKYRGYNPANPNQPDNAFNWYDAVSGQSTPYDDVGHGTHVTGTMVGSEPNGVNQIGVAPGAKWIAVKAFTDAGRTTDDLLEAGEWILAPKDAQGNPHPEKAPDVVNNSWGGGPGMDEWFRQIVTNWRAADIFPEFSAGNDGPGTGSIAVPANYPESFATAATDINNKIASFSSRGPSLYGETKPDISAPGVNIRSSVPGSIYEGGWNGTSMAGPHVSGVVALMRQANPSLTVDDLEQILYDTALPLTDTTYPTSPNNGYGYGLVNAYDAVNAVIKGIGRVQGYVVRDGQDIEKPTYQHTAPAEVYVNMMTAITIQVQDKVSIKNVELQYRANDSAQWQTVVATRTAGDYKNGTYQAAIPANGVQFPSLTYHWRITDYGDNLVTTGDYVVPVKQGISTGYYQNFETQPAGWVSYGTGNSWEWGVPTSGPNNAASGVKVYATNLEGNYDNNANMTLLMPPIDLPAGNAYLQFRDWYDLENAYDYGQVLVSTDQQNWLQLTRITNTSTSWTQRQINLSAYANQRIYIAFNVKTDSSVIRPGWYIDDVAISNTTLSAVSYELNNVLNEPQTNKQAVNPDTIKPTNMQNVMAPTANVMADVQPMSLPVGAKITVVETGRSVNTNPADGSYSLTLVTGQYTLRAEADGYSTVVQQVTVTANGTANVNFNLTPIPQGTVSGTVTNQKTGQPIANATINLKGTNIPPIQTDSSGRYSISANEGSYTMSVSATSYTAKDIQITIQANKTIQQNVQLQPVKGKGR